MPVLFLGSLPEGFHTPDPTKTSSPAVEPPSLGIGLLFVRRDSEGNSSMDAAVSEALVTFASSSSRDKLVNPATMATFFTSKSFWAGEILFDPRRFRSHVLKRLQCSLDVRLTTEVERSRKSDRSVGLNS